jgi:hypothetical protein
MLQDEWPDDLDEVGKTYTVKDEIIPVKIINGCEISLKSIFT